MKVNIEYGKSVGQNMTNTWQQHSDILHCDKGGKLICCFSNQTMCNGLQFINDQVG